MRITANQPDSGPDAPNLASSDASGPDAGSAVGLLAQAARQWAESGCDQHTQTVLLQLLSDLGIPRRDFLVAYQLADAVSQQWLRFHKMCARCRRDFSEDAVHDARVHCRRLIARVSLVLEAVPNAALDPVIRALKRFLKPLGALRDVQVQQRALRDDLARFPEVAGLWIDLGRREGDHTQSANESIAGFKMDRIERQLKVLETELTDPSARLAAKAVLHDSVVRALKEAYLTVLQRKRQMDPSDPATIHRVRIVYKRFRYMVESLPGAVGSASSLQLEAMGHYQTALGRIQDVEVLKGLVSDYARRFPMLAASLVPFQEHLGERSAKLISDYVGMADTVASFWPLTCPAPELADSKD